MNRHFLRSAVSRVQLATLIGAGVLFSVLVMRSWREAQGPSAATVPATTGLSESADAPTTTEVRGALSGVRMSSARTLVVAVRASDCFTCEDLGRQLRELQLLARAQGVALHAFTWKSDSARVTTWLRRERVTVEMRHVRPDRSEALVTGTLSTPAVLLVDRFGRIERGVAHPRRVPNMRLRSFAAELGLE